MDATLPWFAASQLVGWTLVHFLWQGALVGLLYVALRSVLSRGAARYRAGMGALFVLFLCPLLTAWRLLHVPSAPLQATTPIDDLSIVFAPGGTTAGLDWGNWLDAVLPWLVLGWAAGVLLLSLRAWRHWRRLKSLVRMAAALPQWQERVASMAVRFGLQRRVTVLCSVILASPALVGWIRPVIVLPMAVVCQFPANQIEAILAHELAHMRRWDALANLFQVVLETLYFQHPVVHWISADVRNEREICCDKLALSTTGASRHEFATTLVRLGELRGHQDAMLLAATGGVLLDRVQYMLAPMRHTSPSRASARFVALMLGAALLLITLAVAGERAAVQPLSAVFRPSLGLVQASFRVALPSPSIVLDLPALVPTPVADPRPRNAPIAGLKTSDRLRSWLGGPMRMASPTLKVGEPVRFQSPIDMRVSIATAPRASAAPTPLRILQPVYPARALRRGMEGEVVVEFTLASDGSVQDPQVVHAKPAGIFEASAIQAMQAWKYALSDRAMPQRRYRQKLSFMLNHRAAAHASQEGRGDEVEASAGCRIVTGTHICRWPDDMEPRAKFVSTR